MPISTVAQLHASHNATDQIRVISRRRQPWAWFDKRVITRYGRQLGPHGIAVYMALAVHVDGEMQRCFPSYQTLAREIGVSRPTVVKAIKTLLKHQLINKEAMQSPEGDAGPNLYSLLDIPDMPIEWSTPAPEVSTDERSAVPEGVVNDVTHGGQSPLPPVVKEVNPKKNLLERDEKNKGNGQHLHRAGETTPPPLRFGHRGYMPLTREQLAHRKILLQQQALLLAQQEPEEATP